MCLRASAVRQRDKTTQRLNEGKPVGCGIGKKLQGNGSWGHEHDGKLKLCQASTSAIAPQCNIKCKSSGKHANGIKG